MRYSALAALLTVLLRSYGAVDPSTGLHFVEVCAGSHRLTDSCSEFQLASTRVDAGRSTLADCAPS